MTREEKIDCLCRLRACLNDGTIFTPWNKQLTEALDETLKQEPFINKPCISSGVCDHDKNVVIDKIRAEIEKIYERENHSFDCLNALDELKEFLDKYKAESEVGV